MEQYDLFGPPMKLHELKTFPDLYKRTKGNKVQCWTIATIGSKIKIFQGQFGGKLTLYEDVVQGKNIGKSNETKPSKQAQLEAEARWKAKLDEGYKEVHLELDTTMASDELLEYLLSVLPEEKTDASGNLKPMLAQPFNEKKHKFPLIGSPKYDGARCIFDLTLDNNKVSIKAYSREGKPVHTVPHIYQAFLSWLERISEGVKYFRIIFDGEIYAHDLTFQEVISAFKKEGENTGKLHYRVYDIIDTGLTQEQRLTRLDNHLKEIDSPFIVETPTAYISNKQELAEYWRKVTEEGYEGVMLREFSGLYEVGHRSHNLLKYKVFDEGEFKCIGYRLGRRGVQDLNLICVTKEGGVFEPNSMGDLKYKQNLYEELENIRVKDLSYPPFTVVHFGWTDANLPRFPKAKILRDYD